MNILPRNNYVLVEKLKSGDTITKSGLILPKIYATPGQPTVAKVIAVGDGYRRDDGTYVPLQLRVGLHVLITNGGFNCSDNEKDYVLIQEHEVLALIEA